MVLESSAGENFCIAHARLALECEVNMTNFSIPYTVKPRFTNVSEFEQFGFQTEILS